jgi:hypothetical protein
MRYPTFKKILYPTNFESSKLSNSYHIITSIRFNEILDKKEIKIKIGAAYLSEHNSISMSDTFHRVWIYIKPEKLTHLGIIENRDIIKCRLTSENVCGLYYVSESVDTPTFYRFIDSPDTTYVFLYSNP